MLQPLLVVSSRETRPAKVAEALEVLGPRIVSGRYAEGSALPIEAELVRELGLSRTPLRETIKTLITLGLIEVRPRLGTRVRPRRDWNLLSRDVLRWMRPASGINWDLAIAVDEAREIFEPSAAALAADRASRAQITAIRVAYDAMEGAARDGDIPGAIIADKAFHLTVLGASGNPVLQSFGGAIDAMLGLLFEAAIEEHMQSFRDNLERHLRVLQAIEAHQPDLARQAMLDMILATRRRLEAYRQAAMPCPAED
ncbi:MAG: FadR family transcriptional regulator [Rhodobacteraceae bacterium]|jgi:GntR family galactonate operon transcriptional repressor|nr:FadR family transcriptional regulator [Paracoccaceae bacterium]